MAAVMNWVTYCSQFSSYCGGGKMGGLGNGPKTGSVEMAWIVLTGKTLFCTFL